MPTWGRNESSCMSCFVDLIGNSTLFETRPNSLPTGEWNLGIKLGVCLIGSSWVSSSGRDVTSSCSYFSHSTWCMRDSGARQLDSFPYRHYSSCKLFMTTISLGNDYEGWWGISHAIISLLEAWGFSLIIKISKIILGIRWSQFLTFKILWWFGFISNWACYRET